MSIKDIDTLDMIIRVPNQHDAVKLIIVDGEEFPDPNTLTAFPINVK